jgi:hypothetical protein
VARHAHRPYVPAGRAARPLRWLAVLLVWAAGVAAGLFTLLAGGSRFATCSAHATGLACRGTGTVLAVLLLIGIVAVVTTATVLAATRTPPQLAVVTVVAIAVLVGCLVGARSLLATA